MQYTIDAQGKRLGRLASEAALILQGKKSVKYQRNKVGADSILVKNASKIILTVDKVNQKIYQYHTGYMGHLRTRTFKQFMEKQPEKVLSWAIYNMLPKNFLRQKRMNKLKIEK